MTLQTWLVYGLGFILVCAFFAQVFFNPTLTDVTISIQFRQVGSYLEPPEINRNTMTKDNIHSLQCYGCNIIQGQKYVDVGCSNPEVITCTTSHKGFKHRFCIRTESTALDIVLTSGCATSRHCQQHELPGVRIHCCASDLCNSTSSWQPSVLNYVYALSSLILITLWL